MTSWKRNTRCTAKATSAADVTLSILLRKRSFLAVAAFVCLLLTCISITGCGSGTSSQGTPGDHAHIKFVADSYGLFMKEHRRLPNDEAEFREFVTRLSADDPRAKGKTVDELLISPRDGKPYSLITEEDPINGGAPLAAYEQEGIEGRRLVADTAGGIKEVDEATFRALIPDVP